MCHPLKNTLIFASHTERANFKTYFCGLMKNVHIAPAFLHLIKTQYPLCFWSSCNLPPSPLFLWKTSHLLSPLLTAASVSCHAFHANRAELCGINTWELINWRRLKVSSLDGWVGAESEAPCCTMYNIWYMRCHLFSFQLSPLAHVARTHSEVQRASASDFARSGSGIG